MQSHSEMEEDDIKLIQTHCNMRLSGLFKTCRHYGEKKWRTKRRTVALMTFSFGVNSDKITLGEETFVLFDVGTPWLTFRDVQLKKHVVDVEKTLFYRCETMAVNVESRG